MLVAQILKTKGANVVTIERHRTIRDAASVMTKHKIGAVIVQDDNGMCGILSERDVARGLAEHGGKVADAAIDALMTREVVTCGPNDRSDELMDLMTSRRMRHLPVVENHELIGMVSIGDIVKAQLAELQSESEAMQTYIAGMA